MSELILELMSEEMPASLLESSAKNIYQLISDNLIKNNIVYSKGNFFYSPKRLTFIFEDINSKNDNVIIKGPSVNSPVKAVEGFARSLKVNIKNLIKKNTKKGEYFFFEKVVSSKDIELTLMKTLENSLGKIPWKKSMRWGSSDLKWVRPLLNILCLYDKKKLALNFMQFSSNSYILHSNPLDKKKINISNIKEYFKQLKQIGIEVDQNKRKSKILKEGQEIALKSKLKLLPDSILLNEVVSLVENPNIFIAKFDKKYLKLPSEILITSMKKNQKYFPLHTSTDDLSNYFLIIANLKPRDSGKLIVNGNQRVINARLEDAKFFWEKDIVDNFSSKTLELKRVVFHNRLGSVYEKINRLNELSLIFKNELNMNEDNYLSLKDSIAVCKNDLVSEVVREFPVLQGTMGYYYANESGLNKVIGLAIRDHYKPYGPSDRCPSTNISQMLAILDKLDTIVGFFLINEAPSSSKDPFALRRAGLGIIRILSEGKFKLNLSKLIERATDIYVKSTISLKQIKSSEKYDANGKIKKFILERFENLIKDTKKVKPYVYNSLKIDKNNLNFIDINYDCSLVQDFINSNEGHSFLVAFKRILNILNGQRESINNEARNSVNEKLLEYEEEKILFTQLQLIIRNNKDEKLLRLSSFPSLTKPINNFFENVQINDKNINIKINRIFLLCSVKNYINQLVDFSKIIKGKEL